MVCTFTRPPRPEVQPIFPSSLLRSHFSAKSSTCEMASSEIVLQAGRVYRELLRSVKKHIGTEETKRHFREYIAREFRKSTTTTDPSIKLAQDYTYLLNTVHHRKELLFSYNIAIDRSDEVARTLKKSAASVGLQLPEVYQP